MDESFARQLGVRSAGAAHKNMEAPQSIDSGDARKWHLVTSHQSLEAPNPWLLIPNPCFQTYAKERGHMEENMTRDGKEILFDIRHLTHTFETEDGKTFDALSDVTCTIPKGSFTAIIGTNGSGKSTLARHLNALYLPTSGEVIVEGMKTSDMEHIWDIRQKVGMVFQNPDNQLVAAIVEEDVAFGPENLGVPAEEIRKRVDYALEKVGMSAYRTHSPAMLSGGQKQRIAIAGVLAMHPDCIVLDEPTAMLDPLGRKEVMDTIHELNRSEGITIVLITHFMEEAVTADHVLVVDRTKLQMQGTAREVFSQADKLTAMGLDVPVAADLAHGLRKKGYEIPEDCMTDEELGEALCPYASNI